MSPFSLSVAVFFCLSVGWTVARPDRPFSNGAASGAGEIADEIPLDYRPFDETLGKGPGKGVDYDLDEGPQIFPEDYENEISPHGPPGGSAEPPLKPDDRIPEEKHPEDEPEEEEEDREPSSHEAPQGGETHHDEEEETQGGEEETQEGEEEETQRGEEEDSHGVESGDKSHGEEETREGEGKLPIPLNTALFNFQQVNHYIKQLEKAMDHVFKDSLDEASLLNNTFANTTEEEVEVEGHKYKVQKSIVETGDQDKNSTLRIEAISSVSADEPKKNRTERSNPDSEPIQ